MAYQAIHEPAAGIARQSAVWSSATAETTHHTEGIENEEANLRNLLCTIVIE